MSGVIPTNVVTESGLRSIPGRTEQQSLPFNLAPRPSSPSPLFPGTVLGQTGFATLAAQQNTRSNFRVADRFNQGVPALPVNQTATQIQTNPVNGAINLANVNKRAPTSQTTRIPIGEGNITGQIPFFLNAVLSTPAGALPKGPLWVVVFDSFPEVIKQAKDYEPQMPEPWEIERAFGTITSSRYQQEKGCVLAQSVTLPGESLITAVEGNQYNGFIRGRVGMGRQDFDLLRISFLQTNVNFVDNVIRPWTIMTGHLGMISRPPETNYRTNITIYKLGVINRDSYPYIAQQFTFWGACAVNVGTEELTYSSDAVQLVKSADFAYQWYTTRSDKNPFAVGSPNNIDSQTVARVNNPAAPLPTVPGQPASTPGSTFR